MLIFVSLPFVIFACGRGVSFLIACVLTINIRKSSKLF
ncbi:putative membrane protein [Escherichia coli 2-316-03_S1_C2]|nr:putative membrane protein [Escherichia coli STEC_C165-02]KDA71743.1 putative membrane protein [Escherichia coli 2-005-03_S3_C2]KDX25644.1 putative membrane protein [Escherichia coli 1-250-04_S1_C2]KDX35098.1 putative membrane protein [Escherichia coli 1-250-04_S1_C1]KDY06748.1 putative membrane protein [Escherichia coli 2-316-03_S4_C1]KEJ21809.1 putative membrane protein [Escherichia coli 2-316-03_S1_C1]KEJ23214.1 putative membrane protein [Escherichia coli 2-316-03_S1_C2]OSK10739.1 hypot